VNAAVAIRYPSLIERLKERRWELMGHGLDMDHLHYEGMSGERDLIAKCVAVLKPRGWLSPARSESAQTPDLLADAGVEYVCDWVNDDMPYEFKAGGKTLHAMPLSVDIDDAAILVGMHHDEDELLAQLADQFDLLYEEAGKHGGRIMSVVLHPWAIGQPYRIGTLESALAHFMRHPGVWPATGSEILDAWRKQQ
jgi:allantoinase